ncbi:MAG: hypothetical protein ACLFUN_09225, partial [Desulfobacterales bacterium]
MGHGNCLPDVNKNRACDIPVTFKETLFMKRVCSVHLAKLNFCLFFLPLLVAVFTTVALMFSVSGCSSGTSAEVKNSGDKISGLYLVSSGNGDPDNIT